MKQQFIIYIMITDATFSSITGVDDFPRVKICDTNSKTATVFENTSYFNGCAIINWTKFQQGFSHILLTAVA